jgi:hypothetical protein
MHFFVYCLVLVDAYDVDQSAEGIYESIGEARHYEIGGSGEESSTSQGERKTYSAEYQETSGGVCKKAQREFYDISNGIVLTDIRFGVRPIQDAVAGPIRQTKECAAAKG